MPNSDGWTPAKEIVGPSAPVVIIKPYNIRAPGSDQPPSQVLPPKE